MTIKKAAYSDVQTIFDITSSTIAKIYPRYYPSGAVKLFLDYHSEDTIAKDVAEGNVFICFDSAGNPAGTVTICGNEIQRLYVLPRFQGKGFGKKLLEFAENELFKIFDEIIILYSAHVCNIKRHKNYLSIYGI